MTTAPSLNGFCLVKGEERYVFMFTDEQRQEAIKQCGRWAANKELSFTWFDAAVMSFRILNVGSAK